MTVFVQQQIVRIQSIERPVLYAHKFFIFRSPKDRFCTPANTKYSELRTSYSVHQKNIKFWAPNERFRTHANSSVSELFSNECVTILIIPTQSSERPILYATIYT
jgi:hypothetical protein